MIGLEGSGFTICLGLILLLTGIVMYYCKSKITQCNHKVDSMFSLVTELHDEVSSLKGVIQEIKFNINGSSYGSTELASAPESEDVPEYELAVQEMEEDSSDEDSHEEDDEDDENEELMIQTTNAFSNHPYQELIPVNIEETNVESDGSMSEDDTDEEEQTEENIPNIRVVDLGQIEELEELEVEGLEEDSQDEHEDSDTTEESEHENVDYAKLQVAALKRLVSERKLASNVNKLRKAELVQLLQTS